jgi:hypothetical protein
MIKKFILLIQILRKVKFLDKKKINKELIILDEGVDYLESNLLRNYKFFQIRTRYEQIEVLYISPKLIIIFLKNFIFLFFKKNIFIQELYFLSLIETLSPKVVFTLIDNSFTFSKIALQRFRAQIQANVALTTDATTKYHYQDLADKIKQALDPK